MRGRWSSYITPPSLYPDLLWPFKQWGANLVVSAHQLYYQRLSVDGFPSIISGLGGQGKDAVVANAGEVASYNEAFGAIKFRANLFELESKFYNINGVLVDTLLLRA